MVIAKVLDGFVDDSFMNEGIIPHSCPKCLQIFKRIVNPEFTISPKIGDIRYTKDRYCIVSENFQNILYTEQVSRLGVHPDSICRLLLF